MKDAPPPPTPPATALVRWRVVRALGGSGQSQTWSVRQRDSGEQGVLKVPDQRESQWARIRREIAILRETSHPAVAQLLDSEVDADVPWLVTPLGVPLGRWWGEFCKDCTNETRFEKARRFALSLADGLDAVHGRGIVHRDLKPENVIVLGDASDARVVLIDFGVAFVREQPRLTELDNRAVRNRFVNPPEAYYGALEDPPPWWDCLQLAWIWAWMLGDMDLAQRPRFHWKYHPLIEHPRTALFRALLASCSSEIAGPANGSDFIALAQRLGLGETSPMNDDTSDDVFAAAREAAARAAAADELQRAERVEGVEASAAVLGAIYDGIVEDVEHLVNGSQLPLSIARQFSDSAAAALARLAQPATVVDLFTITGKRPFGVFHLILRASYTAYRQELGLLPFTFTLMAKNAPAIAFNSVAHRRDASVVRASTVEPVADNYILTLIRDFISSAALWDPTV